MTRRILNRRCDPLKRRTLEDWRKAFAKFDVLTDAVVCAGRKVAWDYPYTNPVTDCFSNLYHRVAKLPPKNEIRKALIVLGYHPVQAKRAVTAWGQSYRVRNKTEVNAYERHLCSLVAPAFRDDTEGCVSINLKPESKNPSNA